MIRSFDDIWKIEVHNIIPSDNIRVDFLYKISPLLKHGLLFLIAEHFSTYNRCTLLKSKYISDEWFTFSVNLNYVGNLYDRVRLGNGELALLSRAFNIKTKSPEWCNF